MVDDDTARMIVEILSCEIIKEVDELSVAGTSEKPPSRYLQDFMEEW